MDDVWPTWLKVMENGTVGEARSKAFLIDRFWVLERNVDIDGADFLVQRRALTQRFTDRTPPRIGIVQAKYFQDRRTTHYIPHHYVCDAEGAPFDTFFALLHLGEEDNASMYLLSAKQIQQTLSLNTSKEAARYVIGTKALEDKFLVTSRRQALDRIEHALASQSFAQSAAFLDRLHIPFRKFETSDIDYEWTLPFPNPVGKVPEMFFEEKENLRKIIWEFEEVLEIIDSILTERDPNKALAAFGDLEQHIDGYGKMSFGHRNDFRMCDLEDALRVQEQWRATLAAEGVLEAYVDMATEVQDRIKMSVESKPLKDKSDFVEADLKYDAAHMTIKTLKVKVGQSVKSEKDLARKGHVRVTRNLSDWAPKRTDKVSYTVENVWWAVMTHVLEERFPEDPA